MPTKNKVFIYLAYIPPNSNMDTYNKHIGAIKSIPATSTDSIIILGDFNIQSNWLPDELRPNVLIPYKAKPQFVEEFLQEICDMALYQVNPVSNSLGKYLDLIFTSSTEVEVVEPTPLLKIDEYHPPLLLSMEWYPYLSNEIHAVSSINFKKVDYIGLNLFLNEVDFNSIFATKSLEEKAVTFLELVRRGITLNAPHNFRSNKISTGTKCPWSTKRLKRLKNKKCKEWKNLKRTSYRGDFEKALAEYESLNSALYRTYTDNQKAKLKSDPSSFWKYVNSKKCTNIKPNLLQYGHRSSTDEKVQAEMFAEFFSTSFSTSDIAIGTNFTYQNPGYDLQLDENFIFDEMMKLDVKKGTGPDDIHPLVLKNCSAQLYLPLSIIYNESLKKGEFPESWKRSAVRPIFKKGLKSNVENYRCIAKLPTVAKFFERLVNIKLMEIVRAKIVPNQHGFMSNRSTGTNLMEFSYFCQTGMRNGNQIDVLYTDFAKAFDRVNHKILIGKIRQWNLPINLIRWIESYLANRRQFVSYGNSCSAEFTVTSGVPQGSHLGPTLFLLFINDIVRDLGSDVFISLFADDMKIAARIKNEEDTQTLQNAIDKLETWCHSNDLHLNINKCVIMTFCLKRLRISKVYTFGGQPFKNVSEHRDLGVLMDSKLNFNKHCDLAVSKALLALGFVKRFCSDIRDIATLKTLYCSLVQTHLEYCSTVWLPFYEIHKNKIERVLKQFSMYALKEYPTEANNYRINPYTHRLKKLEMCSLTRRRINTAIIFLYDTINNLNNCTNIKNDLTRNQNVNNLRRRETFKLSNIYLQATSTPIAQIVKFANQCPNIFDGSNRTKFISQLKSVDDNSFFTIP